MFRKPMNEIFDCSPFDDSPAAVDGLIDMLAKLERDYARGIVSMSNALAEVGKLLGCSELRFGYPEQQPENGSNETSTLTEALFVRSNREFSECGYLIATFDNESDARRNSTSIKIIATHMAHWITVSEYEKRLLQAEGMDPCTGVFNRHRFIELYETEAKRMRSQDYRSCLAFLDLDSVRKSNENFGFGNTELGIKTTANWLKGAVRDFDAVARVAGDEFAVLFPDCTIEQARAILEHCLGRIRDNPVRLPEYGADLALTFTAAIICFDGTDTYDHLMSTLTELVDGAKKIRRNCVLTVPER